MLAAFAGHVSYRSETCWFIPRTEGMCCIGCYRSPWLCFLKNQIQIGKPLNCIKTWSKLRMYLAKHMYLLLSSIHLL